MPMYLERLEQGDVVGHLAELVGAQVEFDHVDPGADVQRQRRQEILLHVQLGQVFGAREDAVRNLVHL